MKDIYFWRQVFFMVPCVLFSISGGFMVAFPAVLNAAILATNGTDIKTTEDHATWIAATNGLGGIIGSCLLSPILQIFGRRVTHIMMSSFFFIGWIIFASAGNIAALYSARLIQGIGLGGISLAAMIISEYVHPARRGAFITIKKMSLCLGTLICHSMGPYWSWRDISIFAAVLAASAVILTCFWPESPSFLALKGRFEESRKAFEWLYGTSDESEANFQKLMENQKRGRSLRGLFASFTDRGFLKATATVILIMMCLDLCGRYFLVAYINEIMSQLLPNRSSTYYFAIGSDTLTVIAMSLSAYVIGKFKRRTILFNLGGFSVFLMLSISLIVFLSSVLSLSSHFLLFTAVILILHTFIVNLSIIPLTFVIMGEIFPLDSKGIGMCTSGVIFTLFYAVILKLTPILMKYTKLYGTYGIYSVALSLCLFGLHKILVETKDKPLEDIERELRGGKVPESDLEEGKLISTPIK